MNWADLGISYDAAMDTTRTGKPHEGKSAYYSVLYRMNTLLSNGQATSVQDAFKRAVAWVIDNTSAAGRAGLGWTLTSGANTPAAPDYSSLSEDGLVTAWMAAGNPTSGPIWNEIMRRRAALAARENAPYGGGLARGGRAAAGMAYTVGENGPETLFMGNTSGWVSPRSGIDYAKLAAALAQQPIVVTLNGQEVGRLVRDELVRLQRRNGTIGLVGA
jgi:hypothetical protein